MTNERPLAEEVALSEQLISRVLPATSAEEILTKLARALSAEAIFVPRLRCSLWLGIRCWSDEPSIVEVFEQHEVPETGYRVGDARIIGDVDPVCHSAIDVLVRQAQQLDAQGLDAKLRSLAELAAGAGHEVNNPLGSIIGRAQQLLADEADHARRATLGSIVAQAYRGRDMIGDLMLFARPPEPECEVVATAPAIAEVIAEFANELADRTLTTVGRRDPSLAVWGDATQFRIVVAELLRNAICRADSGSAIVVEANRFDGRAQIAIRNAGPGMTSHEREHAFDPFFSGRSAGRGLGFGLSKCWRIVTLHGGSIRLNAGGDATAVVVTWPIDAAQGADCAR